MMNIIYSFKNIKYFVIIDKFTLLKGYVIKFLSTIYLSYLKILRNKSKIF